MVNNGRGVEKVSVMPLMMRGREEWGVKKQGARRAAKRKHVDAPTINIKRLHRPLVLAVCVTEFAPRMCA